MAGWAVTEVKAGVRLGRRQALWQPGLALGLAAPDSGGPAAPVGKDLTLGLRSL